MPTVFITGANRGIGLEFARQYAADGWTVIATARDPGKADELNAVEGNVTVRALDLDGDFFQIDWNGIVGEQPVDVFINNAGVMPLSPIEPIKLPLEAFYPDLRADRRQELVNNAKAAITCHARAVE